VDNKVGFTASSFDLLHAGHVLMLEECKKHCDYLMVGFNVCPIGKTPVESVLERFIRLLAIKYVDEIIPYGSEQELFQILCSKNIDIRFIGEDYKDKGFTGDELPIEIFYISRAHGFSTTSLKNRINQEDK